MKLTKTQRKLRIRRRIRKVSAGTAAKPRLSVFRSNKEIYAQVMDDVAGKTLVAVSSRDKDLAKAKGTKSEMASLVGKAVAAEGKEIVGRVAAVVAETEIVRGFVVAFEGIGIVGSFVVGAAAAVVVRGAVVSVGEKKGMSMKTGRTGSCCYGCC